MFANTRSKILAQVLLSLSILGVPTSILAQSYSDDFEAPTINSFWTLTQQFGTISLSPDQNHTPGGSQSAKFSSSSGGQRNMDLKHTFPSPASGDFSIWFYDVAPGQETLYEKFTLYNSVTKDLAAIGTQDFDAFCYTAQLYNYNTGVNQGPNANCGIYPQVTTTNVPRTVGWHLLEINTSGGGISYSIDGNVVFSADGNYSFDTLDIYVSGPDWRPNTTAYFDDFSFVPF